VSRYDQTIPMPRECIHDLEARYAFYASLGMVRPGERVSEPIDDLREDVDYLAFLEKVDAEHREAMVEALRSLPRFAR
jgi:hypothetical protein